MALRHGPQFAAIFRDDLLLGEDLGGQRAGDLGAMHEASQHQFRHGVEFERGGQADPQIAILRPGERLVVVEERDVTPGASAIGRRVVHHDQFEVSAGLRQHAVDGAHQHCLPVVGGHDHADDRTRVAGCDRRRMQF